MIVKALLILILNLSIMNSSSLRDFSSIIAFEEFQRFTMEYGKKYANFEEFSKRFEIFKTNFENSKKKNSLKKNEIDAVYGITKFSDLTREEFQEKFLGLKVQENPLKFYVNENTNDPLPDNFDWREKGAVSKVKNQYNCGSCWAFSVVGNLEGLNFVKTGKMQMLSEQQLVSCDRLDMGCRGGYMENAFKYLVQAGGIESDSYYYVGFDDECLFEKDKVVVSIKDYAFDKTGDHNAIKSMLMNNAPLSIGLNAWYLQGYKSGVIDTVEGDECPKAIDHGVLLVGFGVEQGKEFWIVKNSWGQDWGESGFFRIASKEGICGVNSYVSTGLLK